MGSIFCFLYFCSFFSTLLSLSPSLQETRPQVPVFRSEVDLVYLVCTVLDRSGNYVPNLTVRDFEVYENDQRQQIEFFSGAAGGEAAPVFMVMALDVSKSVESRLQSEQTAAFDFLRETLSPEKDQAAIVQFSTQVRLVEDFTSDLTRLRRAVFDTRPGGGTRLYDAIWLVSQELLGDKRGRKFLVLFSDGEDLHSLMLREEALRKVQTEHVTIFGIGVRDQHYASNFEALEAISWASGGFFLTYEAGTDRLVRLLKRIKEEIQHQYTLGYISSIPREEGPFRSIHVKVRGRGLKVNHRRGYFVEERD